MADEPIPVKVVTDPPAPVQPTQIPTGWLIGCVCCLIAGAIGGVLYGQRHPVTPPGPGPVPPNPVPIVEPTKDHPIVLDKDSYEFSVGSAEPINYKTFKGAKGVWFTPPGKYKCYWYPDHLIFNPQEEGEWVLGVTCAVDGQAVDPLYVKVKSGKGPQPPPVPPGPGPQPPGPTPIPAPIESPDFKALVIYDDADSDGKDKATKIVTSGDWAVYMKGKMKGSDPAWRFFPKDVVFPDASHAVWQKAMTRPRTALPWLILSDGKTGWEGPLPITGDSAANIAATMALVRKVGG